VRTIVPTELDVVVTRKPTDVSKEHIASVFRIEEKTSMKSYVCCLFSLIFGPEDGRTIFLWNVD
jgi:hypothetical protein